MPAVNLKSLNPLAGLKLNFDLNLDDLLGWVVPAPDRCRKLADELLAAHPNLTRDQIAAKAVKNARNWAAAAGAATGIFSSPHSMLPAATADAGSALRIEATMAGTIAALLDPTFDASHHLPRRRQPGRPRIRRQSRPDDNESRHPPHRQPRIHRSALQIPLQVPRRQTHRKSDPLQNPPPRRRRHRRRLELDRSQSGRPTRHPLLQRTHRYRPRPEPRPTRPVNAAAPPSFVIRH